MPPRRRRKPEKKPQQHQKKSRWEPMSQRGWPKKQNTEGHTAQEYYDT